VIAMEYAPAAVFVIVVAVFVALLWGCGLPALAWPATPLTLRMPIDSSARTTVR
jgi:hypothetical protein